MTPKEAFEKIKRVVKLLQRKLETNEQDENMEVVEQALTELEELKRYPTADEVCKAIQKELDYGTVEYVEGNREFMFVNHGEKQNITVVGDRYKVTRFFKSSTLSLIGRFYEGLGGKIK